MDVKILIVRHGEAVGNVKQIVDGHTNLPLTDVGRRQVVAVGEALKDVHFQAIYSSDMDRALDTAKGVAKANLHFNDEVITNVLLRERYFGVMEGKSYQALRELPGFAGFHGGFTPEGGEDWPQVKERTAQFMKIFFVDVRKASSSCSEMPTYLFVCHGGTIFELLDHIVNDLGCSHPSDLEENFYRKIPQGNTAVTQLGIRVNDDGLTFSDLNFDYVYSKEHLKGI